MAFDVSLLSVQGTRSPWSIMPGSSAYLRVGTCWQSYVAGLLQDRQLKHIATYQSIGYLASNHTTYQHQSDISLRVGRYLRANTLSSSFTQTRMSKCTGAPFIFQPVTFVFLLLAYTLIVFSLRFFSPLLLNFNLRGPTISIKSHMPCTYETPPQQVNPALLLLYSMQSLYKHDSDDDKEATPYA